MNRDQEITNFLVTVGWGSAKRTPLAGDAGRRRYERLADPIKGQAVLMDADPLLGEDIQPFLNIAAHLASCNLSSPKIFEDNTSQGLILMQDFGDGLLFNVAEESPSLELELYQLALEALDRLHKNPPPPNVGQYMAAEMANAAETTLMWYCSPDLTGKIGAVLQKQLGTLDWSSPVLVLRDYHAQNLIYRNDGTGLNKMGLLDFQDAQLGHSLYDAASLINDARRSLNPTVAQKIKRKLAAKYVGSDGFEYAFSALSAQRNLRILALFARLCLRDGKSGYLDLMPHVWDNLWQDLSHPRLIGLARVCADLPPPSPELRSELRVKCVDHPTN
ncbi:MAG: phosphotransferase [Planktomarina sp.]|nr:phosphotransferase [Planktomarina sp.]